MTTAAPAILLTPGPLTTRLETRQAMLRDWGSRDEAFIALTAEMRRRLLALAGGGDSHAAVPLQGSGTFIVEATIATLVGPADHLLVLVNGAYGERIAAIARRLGRRVDVLTWEEDQPVSPASVDRALAENPAITHVALVHCETTTGLLNPLAEIAALTSRHGKALLVDAMSSFGALPIDLKAHPVAAVMASSNKCLEGVPGLGFALIERRTLAAAKGNCPSLSLDLHDQWQGFETNGQWRFTPPVQVVAALVAALRQLEAEGDPPARLRRYRANFDTLAAGMAEMGFRLFLDAAVQAPIIATFHSPAEPWFRFDGFYRALAGRGFLIYPGKLSRADSFRIGCIGAIEPADFQRLLEAIAAIVDEMKTA
ncbi:2-aminoethylphosphonate--pyruvate transaminase [Magnetospirillum sp. SS-4]|uniref:2-aminoethylphosphonate--pyruvate transaminase n=1 Tax=Magnetospirillum sp. SS-4 TaxID=2681465 RepID=UPI00137EF66E|nr:2-aminoethylphosphonate--pyruvate transaminase [Magnetospirillum sp. SS-4]CAA7622429.1 2-aminoethylphosphonate--pyruvate transaminase [Magnetospirillum sp. SS-4]